MVSELWTVNRLSEVTGLSGGHISLLFRQGEIKGEKVGRSWVATDEEAKRWMAERKEELKQKLEQMDV
jgi:hypothetical protein